MTVAEGKNTNPLMQTYDILTPIIKDATKIPALTLAPTQLYDVNTKAGVTYSFVAE